ncbi:MAG TPA: hypothetical protein VLV86_19820, partial [Vicinamibacterales bacterium]|nr:hypothetical protein [Vicinamibacterales bacterium]
LELIASYVAMLTGTASLLLRLGLTGEAAWFGAMFFAFSGFTVFNLMHVNHIATIAHAPWLLLCSYVLMTTSGRTARALAFAGVALVLGSQLLIGHPQYVWMTGLAVAFLAACVIYAGASVQRIALLAGALALGLLIGAVQLLPTLAFSGESVRQTWSLTQSLSFSLSPLNLVQLWSPFAFRFRDFAPRDETYIVHEFVVYNGAFCTVALAWVAARWREQTRRGLLKALLLFAAIALVLAFGSHGVVYPWLAELPGVRNFRAPARHLVLVDLAMSGIAAIALEDLLGVVRRGERIPAVRLWTIVATAALSVFITVIAASLANSAWAVSRHLELSGLVRSGPWAALVVAMSGMFLLAARGVRWAVPVAIVVAAVDLGVWGYSYAYRWGPLESVDALSESAVVPPGAKAGDLIEPMPGGAWINLPILRGLHLQSGYFGIETSSVLDATDPVTLQLAGVGWRPDGARWTRVADAMPRARLVGRAQVSRNIRQEIHHTDIANVALVDRDLPPLSGSSRLPQVSADRPGDITIETSSDGKQLLILTERFHPGWRVSEDGVEHEVVPVYGDYLGCVVDRGRHHVSFRFEPSSVRNGIRATIVGLVLTVTAAAALW